MCNQTRIFQKNCVKTPLFSFFFEIIQTDSLFRLAAALLRMESRLFDNGQTGERSRFPCVEDPNCAHGKHLHFKGLLLVCIMFDTGARSSQSQLVGTSISTTRGYYLHACVLPHTYTQYLLVISYSRLKQVHSFNNAQANCKILVEYNTFSRSSCVYNGLFNSREQREFFELLDNRVNLTIILDMIVL